MVIRVLVADKYPVIILGVQHELHTHPNIRVVGEASNCDEMIARTQLLCPTVLILDSILADSGPEQIITQIQNMSKPPFILFWTTHLFQRDVIRLVRLGAQGYLLKTDDPEVIINGVKEVALGKTWLSKSVSEMVVQALQDGQTEKSRTAIQSLTDRENEILAVLVQGYDNDRIARKLTIEKGTVKNHISNIYSKIGVHSRAEIIVWAWKMGFVEPDTMENADFDY